MAKGDHDKERTRPSTRRCTQGIGTEMMRGDHKYLRAIASAVRVLSLALFVGLSAQSCGADGASSVETPQGGSTVSSTMTALPPIDVAAPAVFQTASFALG